MKLKYFLCCSIHLYVLNDGIVDRTTLFYIVKIDGQVTLSCDTDKKPYVVNGVQ